MESRAKILGHPAHQLLIVFPLGLLGTAVIFDTIFFATNNPTMALVAYWMIAGGLVGGLVAAPLGWIDWFAIPRGTRAKSIGFAHGLANVIVMILFAASLYCRHADVSLVSTLSAILSYSGAILAVFGGWLGGELVSRLGVGVYDGAHLDSPNSLSGKPASQNSKNS